MENQNSVNLFLAFIAGIATFVSPCLFPLIPAYLSFITGQALHQKQDLHSSRWKILLVALFFVIGFTAVFSAMGASATFLGKFLLKQRTILRLAGGFLVIIFGLHLTGIFRIKLLYQEKRLALPKGGSPLKAFLVGSVFAVGWTPCVGPILSSVLIMASTENTVGRGLLLLFLYSLGLGIPFLLAAIVLEWFTTMGKKLSRYSRAIEMVSGLILVVTGFLIMTNRLVMLIPGY